MANQAEHPNKAYFEAVAKAIPAEQYFQYNVALYELEELIATERQNPEDK